MLDSLKEEIKSKVRSISDKISKREIDEELFEQSFQDLRFLLLKKNISPSIIKELKEELKKELIGRKIKKGEIRKKIREELLEVIQSSLINPDLKEILRDVKKEEKPTIFLFLGVNGVGKTVSIVKFAKWLEGKGVSSVFAASDTFRAASMEQLEKRASDIGKEVIKHEYNSDPASVAYDAVEYAKANNTDTVLIDTAGRLHSDKNLMKELKKIKRVAKADYSVLVIDALTGSDAVKQAKTFNSEIGVDGAIITKVDIDEKGGALLSVSKAIGKPIWFLGTGQDYKDLREFNKDIIINQILNERS